MSDVRIEIADRQSFVAVDHDAVRAVVRAVLSEVGASAAEVSVALVGHAVVRPLNVRDLGHDFETDVLSYRLDEGGGSYRDGFGGGAVEAEIVVDCETAAEVVAGWRAGAGRASGNGWNASGEVLLYVTHGMLHVVGYDDATDEDRTTMKSREAAVLATVGLTPPDIDVAGGDESAGEADERPPSAGAGR